MAGYIGTAPVPQAVQRRESFTATASQTSFATMGYTPEYLDVYLNGVHLLDGTDYTATNGSDIVLASGAAAGDVLEVTSYAPFEVVDQTFTGTTTVDTLNANTVAITGGTIDGTVIGGTTPAAISGTTATFETSGGVVSGTHTMTFGDTASRLTLESTNNATGVNVASVTLKGEPARQMRFEIVDRSDDSLRGYMGYDYVSGAAIPNLTISNNTTGSLVFKTSDFERMRINDSGNVGINTTSPSNRLSIGYSVGGEGISWKTGTNTYNNIYYSRGGGNLVIATMLKGSSTVNDGFESSNGGNFGKSVIEVDYGSIQFYTDPASAVAEGTPFTPTEAMRIDSSGRLGIGTTSPSRKVTILGVSGDNAPLRVEGGATTTTSFIDIKDSTTTADFKVRVGSAGDDFVAYAGGSEAMRIDSSGNIGIGTGSPGARLEATQSSESIFSGLRVNPSSGNTYGSLSVLSGGVATLTSGSSGADNTSLAFYTATSGSEAERMRIDSSGRVGIGTTSPAVNLHLDNSSTDQKLRVQSTGSTYIEMEGKSGLGVIRATNEVTVGSLAFETGATPSEAMRIDSSGNVGIGTTTIDEPLVVQGNMKLRGQSYIYFSNTSSLNGIGSPSSSIVRLLSNATDGRMEFQTNGSEAMRIDSSGRVGIGTSSPSAPLDVFSGTVNTLIASLSGVADGRGLEVSTFALAGTNDAGVDINAPGASGVNGALSFSTNSSEAMRIDSSGNVGIGTSSPSGASGLALALNGGSQQTRISLKNSHTGDGTEDGFQLALIQGTGEVIIEQRENNALRFSTNAIERMRIDASGNLLVGTTSISGSTSNAANVIAGKFSSLQGTVSMATSTPTTVITLPSTGFATYMVSGGLSASDTANYHVVAIVCTQNSSAKITELVSANLFNITLSGLNLQMEQQSGVTQGVLYRITRMA